MVSGCGRCERARGVRRSGYGRVKMERDYGKKGAEEGGQEHVGDDE